MNIGGTKLSSLGDVQPDRLMEMRAGKGGSIPGGVKLSSGPLRGEAYDGQAMYSGGGGYQQQGYQQEEEMEDTSWRLLSCPDVSAHVRGCRVCSKLYVCDSSLYIVIIAILLAISLILFKKLVERL